MQQEQRERTLRTTFARANYEFRAGVAGVRLVYYFCT